ncbi:MAG: DUF2490 domain-containing protein [Bacteroidia bacterium]
MKYFLPFLFSVIFLHFIIKSNAQAPQKDFQVRGNIEIEFPINKRVVLETQYQTRFINNATSYSLSRFYFGGGYKITKNLKFSAAYLYGIRKKTESTLSHRHQFRAALTYKKKLGNFLLLNRFMGVMQIKDYYSSPEGKQLRDFYIRNKITLRYKGVKKIMPFIAEESFYKFDIKYYEKNYNRTRLFGGFLYTINDSWQSEICYVIEYNYNSKIPLNNYFLSLSLSKSFF